MTDQPAMEPRNEERLRTEADRRLRDGGTPSSRDWTIGAEALSLLYRLASNPDTAGDALKLLHELQTHQVELDLQHEQIKANERDLAQDAGHYRTLFEYAPVGYLVVDLAGRVRESNRIGAEWLGMEAADAAGRSVDGFLAPGSRPVLTGFLDALREGGGSTVCHVQAGRGGSTPTTLRVDADLAPGGEAVLLILSRAD